MSPFFQISSGEGKEAKILSTDIPQSVKTEEDRRAETMRQRQAEREAERYGTLVSRPLPQDKNMISEETRRHLEASEKEKAEVPNVVTTHSDIAKVAKGADIGLVPTVNVYTKDDPLDTEQKLTVEDRTVTLHGVLQGESVLDRAESSIPQPKGDEYSIKSATGPTLPEGVVAAPVAAEEGEEGETDPAFDVEDSGSDRLEKRMEGADQAAQEAAKVAEKQAEEQAEGAAQSEEEGNTGVADSKSTESGTQEAQQKGEQKSSGSKSSGSKSEPKKAANKSGGKK